MKERAMRERGAPTFCRLAIKLFTFMSILLFTLGSAAAEADYPTRTVRIILGFGPGTSPDVALRVFADKLSQKWGKPVVVENVTGASGNIAGERVARTEPDGHTLLFAANSGIVVSPSLYRTMPYDPVKELKPISILYSHPNILVVHKDVAANTVRELVALARAQPGVMNVASAGSGTTQHLAAEMFRRTARIDIVHVPYLGGTHLMTDLIAGRVQIHFGIPTSVLEQVRDGQIRALAVSTPRRFAGAPELPTMAESGFPDFEMTVWWGLLAPSGTPVALIEKLHQATVEILAQPDLRKRFEVMGIEPVGNSPAEFSGVIAAELPKWAKLIREAGIRLD
jgi:tripartite-type tricarboxylate transporter receptor subunit TctC